MTPKINTRLEETCGLSQLSAPAGAEPGQQCRRIRVTGVVQGVGYRPFVWRLAQELELAGWVRNDAAGVEIEVQGGADTLDRFAERLASEAPRLARVEKIYAEPCAATGEASGDAIGFNILKSGGGRIQTGISPDMTVCPECLAELFDPADRRYHYPFINCIYCGPRYTITARLPYDRINTSMAVFAQCPACQNEYDHPASRRFHAQPNACPVCGPQLRFYDEHWQPVETDDPVAAAVGRIRAGQVIAVKGIGGFHLVCDAGNPVPVTRLRGGKQREGKPFAVMMLNAASARLYADVSDNEKTLLESGERPVVLLHKLPGCDDALPGIAPGLSAVGIMLPYTPLHYLILHELMGRPGGTDWLYRAEKTALVMTSANPGGEPLVKDDTEARQFLSGLADAFLTHDRGILYRCDDSVMKWQGAAPAFIRRARGYTPRRIALPFSGLPVLACGPWMKNTVCLTRGNEAFVSQHIGDLDHAGTRRMLEDVAEHLCDILDVRPEVVAHDLHPDFYSTQFAQAFAARHGLPVVTVQHHHAHIAAVCAEHGVTSPVLGLSLDGVGLGTDGGAWGGELLRTEGAAMRRLGHLVPLVMPGGDRAAREPWRMAAAVLFEMGRADEIVGRFPAQAGAATVIAMLQRNLNCGTTTSMGRQFDAAAALLGVAETQSYEGQAAMLLEGLAERHGAVAPLANGYVLRDASRYSASPSKEQQPLVMLDFRPLFAALADCRDASYGAALFHATLADGLVAWVARTAAAQGIGTIAFGGGCFLNSVLSLALSEALSERGLRVIMAQQLPPNDGAISLGQAWVAMQSANRGA
ncbi:MAG: carbamoyltransferase HypF [Gallionella sp.]|nr:MAG: carbamoyltransferase HypF [Gallionella sp.]